MALDNVTVLWPFNDFLYFEVGVGAILNLYNAVAAKGIQERPLTPQRAIQIDPVNVLKNKSSHRWRGRLHDGITSGG
jgi:hypothetical protein